jgi:hypothetical protein
MTPSPAERCQQCGAAFPRPEFDAELQRASAERIRIAADSIQTMQGNRELKRDRKGLGRIFGR